MLSILYDDGIKASFLQKLIISKIVVKCERIMLTIRRVDAVNNNLWMIQLKAFSVGQTIMKWIESFVGNGIQSVECSKLYPCL